MPFTTYDSPIGTLTLIGDADHLRRLHFANRAPRLADARSAPEQFETAMRQLDEYFAGNRHTFELSLDVTGTAFQRRVWEALQQIPYGTTTTYGANDSSPSCEALRDDALDAVGARAAGCLDLDGIAGAVS
jgi:methylated-DNA-[protein]-cysteine S-methyltransferase